MFPSWRLRIREAQLALKEGRWDEASALLGRESVRDFLPAKRLSHKVASQLVQRAQRRLEQGESSAGWRDLQQASTLGGCEKQIETLREDHSRRGLERIRNLLGSGETTLAGEQIARLEKRGLGGDQRRAWKLIVNLITRAKSVSYRGQMTAAAELLQRALLLLPETNEKLSKEIKDRQTTLQNQAEKLRTLSEELHESVAEQAWTKVLKTAEGLLELAPEHQVALRARRKAWKAIGLDATRAFRGTGSLLKRPGMPVQGKQNANSTHAGVSSEKDDTVNNRGRLGKQMSGKRIVTWIDEVGGYLICLGEEVVLGQPSADGADIPFLADLSRQHATIRREGEAYVLTPIHRVSVDGQRLHGPTVLANGASIELGDSVRLSFRQPHALSTTAVITIDSHHKTEPAVDGIVLMSDSCILGPQPQSHIRCRDWTEDMILFRRGNELQFRTAASVEIDGEPTTDETAMVGSCRIEGEDFTLSFEEI